MKINEITDVIQHPSIAAKIKFINLQRAGKDEIDDIIEFIMNDRNAEGRRLSMLRHLDELLGDVSDHYGPENLDDFMHDQGEPNISAEEAEEIGQDMKIPPYHLSLVTEIENDETPTGVYEICQRCGGEGCIECEEGLKDITGMHKIPDFSDYKGE